MILPDSCNIIIKMFTEMCFLFMTHFMAQRLLHSVVSTGYCHALFSAFFDRKVTS